MSLFRKAKERLGNKLQGAIQDGRNRVVGEVNHGVNRINGLLNPNAVTGTNMPGRQESLYYPLERSPDNPRGDRTAYWLKIEALEQKTITAAENLGITTGIDVIREQNQGILDRTIWLYLPTMAQGDEISVANTDLGVMGRSAEMALQSGSGGIGGAIGSSLAASTDQMASTVSQLRQGATPSVGTIATAIGLAKNVPVINRASNTISSATGITKDPHTISLFQSVSLRKHTFDFDFVPSSALESLQVNEIIKYFRTTMYPVSLTAADAFVGDETISEGRSVSVGDTEVSSQSTSAGDLAGNLDIAFIHPNTFRLTAYRMDDDGNLHNLASQGLFYKDCLLASVSTNFDPNNQMSQRPDGAFPNTKMSLNFVEVETMNRQDIREFYAGRRPTNS